MEPRDPTLDVLLDLDGQVLVVDPEGGHWVRFVDAGAGVAGEAARAGLLADAARAGRREVGWFRRCPSGREAKARRAAGPSPPAADDQGLRLPGCSDAARRFLDDRRCGVARERSNPMTTLKV